MWQDDHAMHVFGKQNGQDDSGSTKPPLMAENGKILGTRCYAVSVCICCVLSLHGTEHSVISQHLRVTIGFVWFDFLPLVVRLIMSESKKIDGDDVVQSHWFV